MEEILSWVKSGLLFGIFSSVILMMSPNKSYEKHISLVVGMLFILVMIHPLISFMDIDEQTYISYLQNFITASENGAPLSDNERILYGQSIEMQLESALLEAGYPVKSVNIIVDLDGEITHVAISFSGEVKGIENVELYIRNVFGREVEIEYEQ